jgi:hypothetical protein
MITVVEMDMWRLSTTRRGKLRRLRFAILCRILVVLVPEDMSSVATLET